MASNHHHPGDSHDDRIGGGRGRGRGRNYYAPSDSSAYDPRRSQLDDRSSYYRPSKGSDQPYGDGGHRGVRPDDDRGRGDYLGIDERGRSHSSREYGRSARERSRSRLASPSQRGGDSRGYQRNEGTGRPGGGESSRGPSGLTSRDRGDFEKEDLEAARRARMARLRAENEEDERGMAGGDNSNGSAGTGADTVRRSGVVDASALEGLDEEEQMRLMLGFDGFGSTKNTKVADNHQTSARGAAAKNKARKYRQYMNRKNGFNRPLDKMD